MTSGELDAFLGMLKRHRVRIYEADVADHTRPTRVEFFMPLEDGDVPLTALPPGPPQRAVTLTETGEPMCACGHGLHSEHNDYGQCIANDCEALTCAKEK